MKPAHTRHDSNMTPWRHLARTAQSAAISALASAALLLAGCVLHPAGPTVAQQPAGAYQPAATQDAAASAPTTQTQPVADAAPTDPADKLAQEVQQYVSNLPMDDLQARLNHRSITPDTQPAPIEPAAVEQAAPAPTAAPRHIPLQPEIVVPPAQPERARPTAQPQPAEPAKPVAPQDTQIVDIEISPAALAPIKSADPAAKHPANQPASVKSNTGSSAGDLKDLLDHLRKEAASRPDSVGSALRLRLAQWSLLGQIPTGEDWPLQDAEKRRLAESVWQVLQVVSKADTKSQRAAGEEFEKALESLNETLRQVQPLKIPSASLCWSVQNFGHYEALPEPWKFPAGMTSMVVLYCELAGFRSEAHPEKPGWYHTLLGERLAILTSAGKEIWNYDEPSIEDLCRRPRRDFFVTKKLKIPGNLPAGDYVLKVTIRDQLANRIAETNVPFEIAPAQ